MQFYDLILFYGIPMKISGFLWEFTELGWNFSNWEGNEWDFHELYGFLWNVGAF